ncbi:MAG TPA: YkgJ family cysteine cluster protein [Chitinivibrionales bacterium]|nr:YkgJ family cysteine cluster protein [Chitinivibrionales bacterium]
MKSFYGKGIRFKCQNCGSCCGNRGEYAFVYVILEERRRLASHLQIQLDHFTRRYCRKTAGRYHLKDRGNHCVFLENGRCGVYLARPAQCRSWPFWPENMYAKIWENEVRPACPGVGKGRLHSAKEIGEFLFS